MKPDSNHEKTKTVPYTVERYFLSMRTAEDVVAALVKAHR